MAVRLAPFLIRRRAVHPEHSEHHATHRTLRIEAADMRHTTVCFRCRGISRARLLICLALMRLAGRIGGFRSVRFVRSATQNHNQRGESHGE